MIKLIAILFLFFVADIIFSQNYDSKWLLASPYDGVFDDQCIQLDFGSNPPILSFRKTPIHFDENSITFSNENGDILFYTNGCDILDGTNSIILSKDSLDLGYVLSYCYDGHPSSQNIIILPFEEDSSYYFFYKDVIIKNPDFYSSKFMYGKISYNLNQKLSISKLNKNFINKKLTLGHISATKHQNLKEWWLIVWDYKSNKYTSVLTKKDTVIAKLAMKIGDTINYFGDGVGQAVFSPNGNKYAFTNVTQGAFIFDFDRTSGTLSNYHRVQLPYNDSLKTFGCAFSSNSRFLYVCGRSEIFQIDTWSNSPDTTVVVVGKFSPILEQCGNLPPSYYKAQLAPDCRIYISATNGVSCLSVIEKPNIKGKDCNVLNGKLSFPYQVFNSKTLPNHPNYRLGTGEVCDSTLLFPVATKAPLVNLTKENILVYPNPTSNQLNIVLPEYLDVPETISIYSLTGILSQQIKINNVASEKLINIDISNLENGMYFVSWIANKIGDHITLKVIKE